VEADDRLEGGVDRPVKGQIDAPALLRAVAERRALAGADDDPAGRGVADLDLGVAASSVPSRAPVFISEGCPRSVSGATD
jgi:hypothetical protein